MANSLYPTRTFLSLLHSFFFFLVLVHRHLFLPRSFSFSFVIPVVGGGGRRGRAGPPTMKKENRDLSEMMLSSSSDSDEVEEEEDELMPEILEEEPEPWSPAATIAGLPLGRRRKVLLKQMSMRETTREAKWEKRRSQILQRRKQQKLQEQQHEGEAAVADGEGSHRRVRSLTDEDLDELRGSIELGFGFDEENGVHNLCKTLPALDLYFAVNRQFSDPKLHSPSCSFASTLSGTPSPRSPHSNHQHHQHSASMDSWTIFNPGDNPQHVKTRLRHWAQVVACSVRQCRQCC